MISEQNYFDHDADIGIIGRGESLEASFEEGAAALFSLMTADLSTITAARNITFEFEESDVELAFVTWLNLLIANAQAQDLVFSHFKVKRIGDHWQCQASGEPWRDNLNRGIDVKGATLTMLSVRHVNNHWESKCIVDV